MEEGELRLDGNALAGPLREVFAGDLTGAMASCASCGHVGPVGAAHLYGGPNGPGGVLRCRRCEEALIVLVERNGRRRLGTPGLRWLEV
ncbi:MAG: hypothetical protein J2P43_02855 [Candidatus Dormibacteraeota bacterium]|nr:hypothetical protein [Candidatus Dormibacteraeota bacterium]